MSKFVLACALAAATLLPAMALPGLAQAQPDPIAERKAGLKRMAGHMEAIKAILDGGGNAAPVAERAADMAGFFRGLPALFPPGSGQGDTKATAAIWSDRAGFEAAAANAAAAATRLQQAATGGDAAAINTAFRETGAACGTCHRGYRAR